MPVSPPFRSQLVARLLRAAGASSTGLMLAAACAGRSERYDDGAAGRAQGTGGAQAGTDGAALGGSSGRAGAGGTALGGTGASGGTLTIDPVPDAGLDADPPGEPMRICVTATGSNYAVTSGTGGSPPCNESGGTSGGGQAGSAGTAAGTGGANAGGQAGGGESGEPIVSCLPAAAVPELQGYECTRGCRLSSTGWAFLANVGGPTVVDGACCYDLLVRTTECVYVGRAFLVDDGLVRSTVREGERWLFGPMPDVAALSAATRAALAEAWLKDAAFEHASVATFARFALQLLAVGAPAELLHLTLAAGNDEVRHAELCFTLASAYAGKPLEPDAFPLGDTLPLQRALRDIVAETIVEGCIGETLAAMQAEAQLAITTDPAVLESLRSTVEDETRHAELAWRVVAWALSVGGPEVRRVAELAFAQFEAPAAPVLALENVDLAAFACHGRLTPEDARAVALEALEHVVRPCAAALLERDVMTHLATPRRTEAPTASA